MTCAHRPLTFSIDNARTLDTLEAILAIARRGGLRLSSLQLQAGQTDDFVRMELLADEADLLALFDARLHNVIGVHAITSPARVVGSFYSDERWRRRRAPSA